MVKQVSTLGRDREATEQRLIDSIGEMISEQGFERIGINAVAARSGVSKILIYRYFGSIEGLMGAYIRKHDFWMNFSPTISSKEEVPQFVMGMFRQQIEQLRSNAPLRMLCRWELSTNNEITSKLREQRERSGVQIVDEVSRLTGIPKREMAVMASVVTASINYLVMLGEFCPYFNGIPIAEDEGWDQMMEGIQAMVDKVFKT